MTCNFDNLAKAAFIEGLFAQWAESLCPGTYAAMLTGSTDIQRAYRAHFVKRARALLGNH